MREYDSDLHNEVHQKRNSVISSKRVQQAKGTVKTVVNRAKTTAVRVKTGQTALVALKAMLKRVPGVPSVIRDNLDSEYADLIIGGVIATVVPLVTTSERANRLAEDICIACGVEIAGHGSFIDEFIETFIEDIGIKYTDVKLESKDKAPNEA